MLFSDIPLFVDNVRSFRTVLPFANGGNEVKCVIDLFIMIECHPMPRAPSDCNCFIFIKDYNRVGRALKTTLDPQ